MKKYGVLARNRGMWGGMTSWCKGEDGKPLLFDTFEEAQAAAKEFREEQGYVGIRNDYFPKEYAPA